LEEQQLCWHGTVEEAPEQQAQFDQLAEAPERLQDPFFGDLLAAR